MSEYKGRILSDRNVLEATFRSFYGTDLIPGRAAGGRGSRARAPLPVPRDPGDLRLGLVRIRRGPSAPPARTWPATPAGRDTRCAIPEQRLYKVATCQPLGYIDAAGAFRKPKSLPAQFARVTGPHRRGLRVPARADGRHPGRAAAFGRGHDRPGDRRAGDTLTVARRRVRHHRRWASPTS
jgi:hypothetical protein